MLGYVLVVGIEVRKERWRADIPIGMTALERSQLPSWRVRIAEGDRPRRSSEEMLSTVGAAMTEGAKARARAKTLVKSIVAMWLSIGVSEEDEDIERKVERREVKRGGRY